MSKKITAIVLSLVMVFTLTLVGVTSAFAADDEGLTVKATSNLFSESSVTVSSNQNQVRVTFTLNTSMNVLNMDCELIYDPAVLTPTENENTEDKLLPVFSKGVVLNGADDLYSLKYGADDSRRVLAFNTSDTGLYDFSSEEKVFVTALFDVKDPSAAETVVELWVKILGVAETGSGETLDTSTEMYPVDYDGEVIDTTPIKSATSSVTALPEEKSSMVPDGSIDATDSAPATNPTSPGGTVSFIYGDVNEDGSVDISDATLIQKFIADIVSLTDTQKLAANVNGDETVDISDATTVQKFVALIIDKFPAEEANE